MLTIESKLFSVASKILHDLGPHPDISGLISQRSPLSPLSNHVLPTAPPHLCLGICCCLCLESFWFLDITSPGRPPWPPTWRRSLPQYCLLWLSISSENPSQSAVILAILCLLACFPPLPPLLFPLSFLLNKRDKIKWYTKQLNDLQLKTQKSSHLPTFTE